MRRFTTAYVGVAAIVALLVFWFPGPLAVPVSLGGASTHLAPSTPAVSPLPTLAATPTAHATASGYPYHPVPPALDRWNNSAYCQNRLKNYWNWYGPQVPTDVRHTEQSPCYIGHDEPGLNFISNASYAGSRVRFTVQLPPAGTNTASAFSTFWVGMWLAGVPCSYRGQSYLEVQINPPYNILGLTPNPNWTVQAPVWDLVPAGSCDPQCQNDTAFSTIGGIGYCEDDAAISGVGTYTSTGWGNFHPGDLLTVDMVGAQNGASGLSVYLNDSTNLTRSLAWQYSPAVTTDHLPLTPFYNSSGWNEGGWGYGLNVEATWENCPEPAAADFPSPCNSYDGPAVSSVGVPQFLSAMYWNATSLTYSNPYPWTATTSSAGDCSGFAAPCQDYTTYGGTGSYPYWSLHAFAGKSWWVYGDSYPNQATDYGGPSSEFNPLGFVPVYTDPTAVYHVTNTSIANTFYLTSTVADPNGVRAVQYGAYFCFGSATPSVATTAGTLAITSLDTTHEGNWSGSFATGSYKGTIHYWVKAESSTGVWSNPIYGSASIAGVTACSFSAPVAPGFALANVTSVGGGYALNWTEASTGVSDYTVWFNATVNGTPFPVDAGAQRSLSLNLGADNQSFTVAVKATSASGLTSPNSTLVTAPATLFTLQAKLVGPTSTIFWVHQATAVSFTATATGGKGPFTYVVTFGDGTTASYSSPNASITFTHNYGSYWGDARSSVAITDKLGDSAASPRQLIQIWATPLGPPQTIAAGEGYVNISWTAPLSPAGPVTYYTVYYTLSPLYAYALTSTWPYNYTPYALNLWNTTHLWLQLSVPDHVTIYAQVCAWNSYGEGLLSATTPYLIATPAPFLVSPISAYPGGPAPFTDTFSAFVTNGTNDAITSAIYSSGVTSLNAVVSPFSNGSYVNATMTFAAPGTKVVVLHVADQFADVGIVLAQIDVTPGVGPTVALTPPTANGWFGWAGSSLPLGATASGTSGPYLYRWSFGDGSTMVGQNVSHIYTAPGNYTILLTASDNTSGGSTTRAQGIIIYALPAIGISTAPGPNGAMSFNFSALVTGGSGPAKVTWSFGDANVATGTSAEHDYASAGAYLVNASATDPSGKAASATFHLTVTSPSSKGTGGTYLGVGASTFGPLAIAMAVLAAIFLLGLIYFWSRSRRPVMMAPEAPKEPEERMP